MYSDLAPGPWFRSVDEADYIARYSAILAELDPHAVALTLAQRSGGRPVALLCYERAGTSDGWCHRSLVARWLSEGLGTCVPEFGYEELPIGQHPLLPPILMA